MKKLVFFLLVFSLNAWAQMALPIQQSVLPKNSLVVDYDFSKSTSYVRGSTTVNNMTGNGTGAATLVQSPTFMNSLGFVSFNGTNQYLVSPNLRTYFKSSNASVQSSFTMSFWFYPTNLNGVIVSELNTQTLGAGWHATNIEIVNGIIKYRVWPSLVAVSSSSIVSLNQWYHIALVYDGTNLKGYLNGVLQGTQPYTREIPPTYQHFAIAAPEGTNMGSGGYGSFNLAQFKLYHLPYTDSDIIQEYNLRKDEFDYTIHTPSTNTNPTYWNISSAWNYTTGSTGAGDPFGTFHYTPWLNSSLGWAAQVLDQNQYITLSYDEPALIKGIVTQGRANNGGQWVTSANIETSATGSAPWSSVLLNRTLHVNSTDDVLSLFTTPVFAKSVKVSPTGWNLNGHMTMRMGLLVKPSYPITDGLVLNLDPINIKSYQGTGSTLSDLSTSNNHATISGTPTYNGATGLTFNGTTQYGRIPSVSGVTDFTNTQQYAIEVWFNPSNGQPNYGEAELLEKWNYTNESKYPFTIRFNEGGSSILVSCYDGANFPALTASGFSVNTWYQLVAVFDFASTNKTLTIYRNGVSVATRSLVGINQVSNTSPVGIAGRVPAGSAGVSVPFKGTIGNIRIYNKAISADQILQNFNSLKSRYGL